jgi:hypothetical protein
MQIFVLVLELVLEHISDSVSAISCSISAFLPFVLAHHYRDSSEVSLSLFHYVAYVSFPSPSLDLSIHFLAAAAKFPFLLHP